MKGQWLGRTISGQAGRVIVNVDEGDAYYSGVAYFLPDENNYIKSAVSFNTTDKSNKFNFRANINPIDPGNWTVSTWDILKPILPDKPHSSQVDISGHFESNDLYMRAVTDLGVTLECSAIRKPFSDKSSIIGEVKTWNEFKEYVASFMGNGYLYRGQENKYCLRTSFHRCGRFNLSRFVGEDIPKLHQRLTARTRHVFNLANPLENGAFYNLAQHHGYPTPLLDWTYSPYVAAFFAFRKANKINTNNEHVRIYIFDQRKWKEKLLQFVMIDIAEPHLSILEFLAIDNERVIPQQAVTTVTNLDDIEEYISVVEKNNDCKFVWAIDIPSSERKQVMMELSYMGITAGSMFPGLDGTCEELREKLFNE